MSKFSRSGGVKSAKIRSGGVRTGPSSTFAAMASLCEEEEGTAVAKVSKKVEMTAEEAVKAGLVLTEHGWEGRLIERGCDIVDILRKGEWSWGAVDNMRSPQILSSAPQDLRGKDELMATFGPRGLEEAEDIFLTEDMSDEDYCDFMRWLYRHGWDVVDEIREGVEAYPAFFLCREWIPKVEVVYASVSAEQAALLEEDRENMLRDRERMERKHKMKEAKAAGIAVKSSLFASAGAAGGGWSLPERSSTSAPAPRQVTLAGTAASAGAAARLSGASLSKGLIQPKAPKVEEPLSAPGSDVGRRNGCPVGRFCKEATACPTAGCRYVHGNTIPRVNEPCKFGEGCGSGDAAKRATCLRMHPGETWTPELVIKRV